MFASPPALGQNPYWPDAVLKRHIFPAAKRAGITKRIGWHSFRRTLATLFQSSGASVKTTQELFAPLFTRDDPWDICPTAVTIADTAVKLFGERLHLAPQDVLFVFHEVELNLPRFPAAHF